MPLSDTDIVNKALVMIGQRPITSLSENSDTALAVRALYYMERDAMLRRYRWNFALKWAALTALSPVPLNMEILPANHGPGVITYNAAYGVPADFLRLSRFAPEDSHWRLVNGDPYGFNGMVLITDAVAAASSGSLNGVQPANADGAANVPTTSALDAPSTIGIEYVARVADPNRFDPLFVDYLATKLARELTFALSGMESQQDRMGQAWKEKELEAAAVNGMENWPDQVYDTTIADVRYGYSGAGIGR